MAFCQNCGTQLADGAKFCASCGSPVGSTGTENQRRQVYEGEIRKCPSCGESISAFDTVCQSCGYEFRGRSASSAVRNLTEQIALLEAARPQARSTLKELFTEDRTDDKIAETIKNFPIPNTREEILEFAILASSNIEGKNLFFLSSDGNGKNIVTKAWLSKFEQAYSKSKLALQGDTAGMAEIQRIYDEIQKKIRKGKLSSIAPFIVIGALFLIAGILTLFE